jgi:hypothetical protein
MVGSLVVCELFTSSAFKEGKLKEENTISEDGLSLKKIFLYDK